MSQKALCLSMRSIQFRLRLCVMKVTPCHPVEPWSFYGPSAQSDLASSRASTIHLPTPSFVPIHDIVFASWAVRPTQLWFSEEGSKSCPPNLALIDSNKLSETFRSIGQKNFGEAEASFGANFQNDSLVGDERTQSSAC